MKNQTTAFVFVTLFLLAVISRLVPHNWNFTLVGAVFIFAGAYFKDRKLAATLMLSSLLVSDFFIGFHSQMLAVYAGCLAMLAVGVFLNTDSSRIKILGYSVGASLLFYIISNFGVWYEGKLYSHTWSGFVDCYAMAIPFYQNQFVADVGFSLAFFEAAKRLLAVPFVRETTR